MMLRRCLTDAVYQSGQNIIIYVGLASWELTPLHLNPVAGTERIGQLIGQWFSIPEKYFTADINRMRNN